MGKITVLSVFGTRPEAVKMAPLVKELCKRAGIKSKVLVTAQHREMLDGVLGTFNIAPDYDLDIMKSGQTIADVTTAVVAGLSEILKKEKPDLLLVHGDTTTAFSSAYAAFIHGVTVGHVEAGLRTFNKLSPFPEEMNRQLIARLASIHFAPTARNRENLLAEGVNNVYVTGNTVIDALKYTVGQDRSFLCGALNRIDFSRRRVITLTCHRRENLGRPMEEIFSAVREIAQTYDDVVVVYPVHPNPAVQASASRILGGQENILLIDPVDAIDMHNLMERSYLVLTDSGGLQEEAPALGIPVLVLRKETERPEAVEAGTVKMAGVEKEGIVLLAKRMLDDETEYARCANAVNPYGDGKAAVRIADAVEYEFGLRPEPPGEFIPGF